MDLYDAISYHQLVLNTEGKSAGTAEIYMLYQQRFLAFLEQRAGITLRDLQRDHLKQCEGVSAARRKELEAAFQERRESLVGLSQLTPLNVRQFILWMQKRGVGKRGGKSATAYALTTLKLLGAFLHREKVWDENPLGAVKRVKIGKVERVPYTRAEVHALLSACETQQGRTRPWPSRNRALVLLLLDTGVRAAGLTGLTLDRLDLTERTMQVVEKGDKERTVPFGDPQAQDGGVTVRSIRAYLKDRDVLTRRFPTRHGERVFVTERAYPMTVKGLEAVFQRLGRIGGVEDAIPHRMRHTFATAYLTTNPGDVMGLRRLMGHVSEDAINDYIHFSSLEIAKRARRGAPTRSWLEGTA